MSETPCFMLFLRAALNLVGEYSPPQLRGYGLTGLVRSHPWLSLCETPLAGKPPERIEHTVCVRFILAVCVPESSRTKVLVWGELCDGLFLIDSSSSCLLDESSADVHAIHSWNRVFDGECCDACGSLSPDTSPFSENAQEPIKAPVSSKWAMGSFGKEWKTPSVLSGPLRLRVQSRSRTRLRIAVESRKRFRTRRLRTPTCVWMRDRAR